MEDKNNTDILDALPLTWGCPPVALLPLSLRSRWQNDPLPDWVRIETHLGPQGTLGDLGEAVWSSMPALSPRLRNFLALVVSRRLAEVRDVVCVDRAWPPGLSLSDIGWPPRVRNALQRAGMLAAKRALTDLTFGGLSRVRGLGAYGALAFSCTLEAAIDHHETVAAEYVSHRTEPRAESPISELSRLGEMEWADQISGVDPRFSDILRSSMETIRERVDSLLQEPAPDRRADEGLRLAEAAGELKQRVARIQHMMLEEALLGFLEHLTNATGARFDMIADRLGWSGSRPPTLKECAGRVGLTRERVRQLEMKVKAAIPPHEVFMPPLDQAIGLLEQCAPISVGQASALLQERGVASALFDIPTLLGIASLLHKRTTLGLSDVGGKQFIAGASDEGLVSTAFRVARKLAGRSGLTSVFHVQDALELRGSLVDDSALRSMLEGLAPVVCFVDTDWFVVADIPPERNRLRNTIRRMLSVTSPQSVGSLREGVRRAYRGRKGAADPSSPVVPPLTSLCNYIAASSEFILDGDLVRSSAALDYTQELGETERIMVDVLRASPSGVLDRRSLAEACVSRGMNENTFNVYTTYSAVLEHIGTDLWKQRGTAVDPAAVEAVRIANRIRPREKRVLEFEWTAGGQLRLALLISAHPGDSLVFGCPSSIRRFLVGQEFECYARETGLRCGTVRIDDRGSMYGWGTFVHRHGLDSGDVLLAELDIQRSVALLGIAGESELEE